VGRNIHLVHGCPVIGDWEEISMHDFSGLAFGVTIFAQSDDYNGDALTNPTVPMKFGKMMRAGVEIGRHAIVGAGTIIFPGVTLGEDHPLRRPVGLQNRRARTVYFRAPAKRIKNRRRNLLELEKEYMAEQLNNFRSGGAEKNH
jgi:acetyltransferase-like isoleucine patch superfamily enzyme